ncbi:pantoate--beta-alanine ligase [Fusibacter bizertensis]|uniref:Pantothenate synthetase n=1 Tax=Fusibacter bizertensis TaxID=1488331 RepID=A0ABT6NB59_9FIRM|nr:pantoate--beta-alanine ligase [Fusibacter bizertensis]MDH8677660.1 pantoate--beta-alanine ligase [Fusibacter bizertensis]
MITVKTIKELRSIIDLQKSNGKTIGFVPTMGFLHQGHLSLMQTSKEKSDFTVVSIFVNPTQFGPKEDLATYPRDLERDQALCDSVGVDLIFAPEVSEMYPEGYSTYVDCEGNITKQLCGASRPSHFKGVTSVVAKLFNIVQPDFAFFGQKDAQQVAVIEKMVRELNFSVKIIPCPIVREEDGLAMSSRNTYLDTEQRKEALVLNRALKEAKKLIENGEREAEILIQRLTQVIETSKSAIIDYIQIVDVRSLESISKIEGEFLIALAVKFGSTRLIDNYRGRVGGQ